MLQENQNIFKFSIKTIAIPLYTVLFLWILLWMDFRFNLHFVQYGVYPRTFVGLRGIFFEPFIHKDMAHLANNSLPLLLMLMALLYFYRNIAFKVILRGVLLSGLLTWIIGRPAYHIGASGVIYFLVSFTFFSGIFSKYYRLIAVSLIVVFLYGGLLWYVFPIDTQISWEGHLSGFIVGILLAYNYRNVLPKPEMYEWETDNYQKDDFDKLFDDNGNFNPPQKNEEN